MPVVDSPSPSVVRFAAFELDLRSGELRKAGVRVRLHEQPFRILKLLLERPGGLVTRDELRQALWPSDTFVDFEHGLNAAVKRLRETLGDSADAPRYIETIPRRGYRLIAPVDAPGIRGASPASALRRLVWPLLLAGAIATAGAVVVYLSVGRAQPAEQQPTLMRVTFESGFQHAPTWSPDGRFIAYGSAGPTLDVWVQPVAGGNPVQVTRHPARDWFPNWSPDGTQIVFRSEREGGGLYLVPVLGGQERKLTGFGYYPRWSPDGSRVLFTGAFLPSKLYTVGLDGSPPQEVAPELSGKVDHVLGNWHPDGRLSITTFRDGLTEWDFWTVPLSGGAPVRSARSAGVERTFKQAGLTPPVFDYVWAPSGDAIFFSGRARGVSNIWKVSVDPETLEWVSGPEQLTSGAGDDVAVAISPDGSRLAFNIQTEQTRLWALPFDAAAGRVVGTPEPLTPEAWLVANAGLSPDGRRLAFLARRRGDRASPHEVWAKDLDDGSERLLVADAVSRGELRWSADATRLAYSRRGQEVMIYDTRSSEEAPLASAAGRELWVTDWSRDGAVITAAGPAQGDRKRQVLWVLPVTPDGGPDGPPRLIASNPKYAVYQTTTSPDGRWICFQAVEHPQGRNSRLYVVPASGGAWSPVTDGGHWDDKPRWAPDGKTIYFLSNRASGAFFLDLWGVRFDADAGRALGEPFRIETPELPGYIALVGDPSLAVAANRVVLTASTVSGNVWVLEGVDRK